VNSRCAPDRIRFGDGVDQPASVCRNGRCSGAATTSPSPEKRKGLSMPVDDRFWFDDDDGSVPAGQIRESHVRGAGPTA
jgi:hypothetical protein